MNRYIKKSYCMKTDKMSRLPHDIELDLTRGDDLSREVEL